MRRVVRWAVLYVAIAIVMRADFPVGVAILLMVLALVSSWYPRHVARSVEVSRSHPTRVFHGEEFAVTLSVSNGSRLPIGWLSVTDAVPFDLAVGATRWVTPLDGGETRTFTRRMRGGRRGLYRFGPGVAITGDPFGFGHVSAPSFPSTRLVVYPKIVPIQRLGLDATAPEPQAATRRRLFEDPHRLLGVREYSWGDPIRSIHWTASAAHGELLVKQQQPATDRQTVICLDMAQRSYRGGGRRTNSEVAVTAAASLIYHIAEREQMSVGLRVVGSDPTGGDAVAIVIDPRPDRGHLVEMLEVLARVRVARHADPVSALAVGELPFGSTVVYVGGGIDERRAAELLRLRDRGMAPSAVVVGDAGIEWDEALGGSGVVVRRIPGERAVMEMVP